MYKVACSRKEASCIISGKPVRIKLTDYGFEYYGDHAELARVREKRCVYHGRAVSPTKEN